VAVNMRQGLQELLRTEKAPQHQGHLPATSSREKAQMLQLLPPALGTMPGRYRKAHRLVSVIVCEFPSALSPHSILCASRRGACLVRHGREKATGIFFGELTDDETCLQQRARRLSKVDREDCIGV
jgi:hypothetical protein